MELTCADESRSSEIVPVEVYITIALFQKAVVNRIVLLTLQESRNKHLILQGDITKNKHITV